MNDYTFNLALQRARAQEAADIRAAAHAHPAALPIIGARAAAKPVYFKPSPMVQA